MITGLVVARRDGAPIVWPGPTHGKGRLPFRTAAECIDWSLVCPSIFERKRELKPKTLWRIAQGIKRFVIDNPQPFIVKVNHGMWDARVERLDEPLTTVTATQRGHALVIPHVSKFQENSVGQDPREPLHTVLAGAQRFGIVAPTLVQTGYGERDGQAARVPGLDKPLGTVVAGGQKHALVAAFIAKYFGDRGQRPGSAMAEPLVTITSSDHNSLAAATLRAQGTLLTAVRGCDLTPKYPLNSLERRLVGAIRHAFMVPADPREVGVEPGSFFVSEPPLDFKPSELGHYPWHWLSHLMHASEVIAYSHPDQIVRQVWLTVYLRFVHSFHLNGETPAQWHERMTEDRVAAGTVVS